MYPIAHVNIPWRSDVVSDLTKNCPSDPLQIKYVRFSNSANPSPARILSIITSVLKTVVWEVIVWADAVLRTSSPVALSNTAPSPVPASSRSPIPVISASTVVVLIKNAGRHCFLETSKSEIIAHASNINPLYHTQSGSVVKNQESIGEIHERVSEKLSRYGWIPYEKSRRRLATHHPISKVYQSIFVLSCFWGKRVRTNRTCVLMSAILAIRIIQSFQIHNHILL